MHFGEIRGMMLLTVMLTISLFVIERLTHPTTLMDRAIDHARVAANKAPAASGGDDHRQSPRRIGAVPVAGNVPAGQGGQISTSLGASGYRCPIIRRVTAISGGSGIYRIVCIDHDGGAERSYRLDTRKGIATGDAPIA